MSEREEVKCGAGGAFHTALNRINEKELRHQVNRMIDAGVHGIFAFGTNGESYALSPEEKVRILEIVVEETKHRVPVYAGTGCVTTSETVRMSRKAQEVGADVLSVITPWFAAASQDELYDHYKAVAEAVDLPIVLYNIPARRQRLGSGRRERSEPRQRDGLRYPPRRRPGVVINA